MASTSPEAETVHTLLRYVLRGFYNTRQIIAYDILLKHATLRDIHLANLMNLTPKEVHKFLAPLLADSILQQHSKTEPKTPQKSNEDVWEFIQIKNVNHDNGYFIISIIERRLML